MIRIIAGIFLFLFGYVLATFRSAIFGIKEASFAYSFFSIIMGMVSFFGIILCIKEIRKIRGKKKR